MLRTRVSYSPFLLPLVTVMGLGPKQSLVAVDAGRLYVRMGWGFRAEIPLTSVCSVTRAADPKWWWGAGVHRIGRNTWIVNGTLRGLIEIELCEPIRAKVLGIGTTVERLVVSVSDPDGLMGALPSE